MSTTRRAISGEGQKQQDSTNQERKRITLRRSPSEREPYLLFRGSRTNRRGTKEQHASRAAAAVAPEVYRPGHTQGGYGRVEDKLDQARPTSLTLTTPEQIAARYRGAQLGEEPGCTNLWQLGGPISGANGVGVAVEISDEIFLGTGGGGGGCERRGTLGKRASKVLAPGFGEAK